MHSVRDLGPQNDQNGKAQSPGDAPRDHLVRRHPPRHHAEDPSSRRDRVVGSSERVRGVNDRLSLPLEILEDGDAKFLEWALMVQKKEGIGIF